MPTAKITSKGQITIPNEVRKALNLKPGDRVDFFQNLDGEYVLFPMNRSIMDLRGILAGFDVPKTDEEMNEAIGRHLLALDEATKSGGRSVSDDEAA